MSPAGTGREAVAVWRIESACVVGTLARVTGDVALAEDLAQEAFAETLVSWPRDGVPATVTDGSVPLTDCVLRGQGC